MASARDTALRHLADAERAGPYLWSNVDVENALLWFRSSPSLASGGDAAEVAEESDNEGCEFLRRLLHARGTTMPRPPKQKRKKKDAAGSEKSKRKRSKKGGAEDMASESSPLQSVMTGYYQLFLPPEPSTTSIGDNEDVPGKEDTQFTASDIKKAGTASSQLLDDLSSIVLARRHTNDIYQAFMSVANREEGGADGESSGHEMTPELRMIQIIDEYMTHPATCAQRVYASNIFDRLLDLCRSPDAVVSSATGSDGAENKGGSNPALRKYLQKLFGLASANVKIQEVILLLLLEPVRRLQQSKGAKPPPEPRENKQQSPSADLCPLMLSQCWIDISPEAVEKECSRPPLPALIAAILDASQRSNKQSSLDGASRGKNDFTQTISWWALPSPLLCAVSQMHFPVACEYIRHCIDRAVIGHGRLYGALSSPDSSNRNEEDSFQHAMKRIQQFLSTSERLHLLGIHILHSMQEESQESFEEDEDAAFRKSLAWKAIHHIITSSNISLA